MKRETYHHTNLKQTLIIEGIRYINAHGLQEFSMRKLAAACGVSHMASYRHFKNKEEYLKQVFQFIDEEFAASLQMGGDAYQSPDEAILSLGKRYIQFMCEQPDIMRFIFRQGGKFLDLKPRSYEIFLTAAVSFLRAHHVPENMYEREIRFLWAIVIGLGELYSSGIIKEEKDYLASAEASLRHEVSIRTHWYSSLT